MAIDTTTIPDFIVADANQILADCVAFFEGQSGKKLQRGQVEKMIVNLIAYREKIIKDQINSSCSTQLLRFSSAPMLDYLVELVGVIRIPAQAATVQLQYDVVMGHTGVTVPAGHRVGSVDGKVVFETIVSTFIPVGTYEVFIEAACQSTGVIGNGYGVGTITSILDPLAFLVDVTNPAATDGGSDQETDDHLRDRAKLAPDAFSNAGSVEAYKYWAKTAHPSIIDVAVTQPTPGTVKLWPLIASGTTPSQITDAVLAVCSQDHVRPLSDTVQAATPTAANYDIVVNLTAFTGGVDATIINSVTAALTSYAQAQKLLLAQSISVAKLIDICMRDVDSLGNNTVFDVAVPTPSANVAVGATQWANIGTITVNIVGHH